MPPEVVERWVRGLLSDLAAAGVSTPLRLAAESAGLAGLVVVWPAGRPTPVVVGERRAPASRRAGCRADILAALAAAGRPLTRKELAGRLRGTADGPGHGAGTVAKALAELTTSKSLVNTRDKRGYRLPAWLASQPTLFADWTAPRPRRGSSAESNMTSPRRQPTWVGVTQSLK
jgi:hypothetical protein